MVLSTKIAITGLRCCNQGLLPNLLFTYCSLYYSSNCPLILTYIPSFLRIILGIIINYMYYSTKMAEANVRQLCHTV